MAHRILANVNSWILDLIVTKFSAARMEISGLPPPTDIHKMMFLRDRGLPKNDMERSVAERMNWQKLPI